MMHLEVMLAKGEDLDVMGVLYFWPIFHNDCCLNNASSGFGCDGKGPGCNSGL